MDSKDEKVEIDACLGEAVLRAKFVRAARRIMASEIPTEKIYDRLMDIAMLQWEVSHAPERDRRLEEASRNLDFYQGDRSLIESINRNFREERDTHKKNVKMEVRFFFDCLVITKGYLLKGGHHRFQCSVWEAGWVTSPRSKGASWHWERYDAEYLVSDMLVIYYERIAWEDEMLRLAARTLWDLYKYVKDHAITPLLPSDWMGGEWFDDGRFGRKLG